MLYHEQVSHHLRRLPPGQRGRQQPLRRLPLLGLHGVPHGVQPTTAAAAARPEREQARAGQPGRDRGARASPHRDAPDPQRRQGAAQRRVPARHRRPRLRGLPPGLQPHGAAVLGHPPRPEPGRGNNPVPGEPGDLQNTAQNDTRLFDPAVGNATFNGRNANQYILARTTTATARRHAGGRPLRGGHGLHRLPRQPRPARRRRRRPDSGRS
jgi:hypothetical protein